MVQNLEINGVHLELDENLKKYITKKINKLEKYISHASRESLKVEVYIQELKSHADKQCECEVLFYLPKETIRIKDSTMNMYAAIDIVEEKMKQALGKYKDQHDQARNERHLLNRVHADS